MSIYFHSLNVGQACISFRVIYFKCDPESADKNVGNEL
jgi:hypothetical protein